MNRYLVDTDDSKSVNTKHNQTFVHDLVLAIKGARDS